MSTIVQRQATQIASITRTMEKMRDAYYTTKVERMVNGSQPIADQESLLLFRSNEQYIEYLKDWYFVKTLLGFYTQPVLEILKRTEFQVAINDQAAQSKEMWVNNRLSEINLKQEIIDNIDDAFYTGKFFRVMLPTANDTFRLLKLDEGVEVDFAYQSDDRIGYIIEPGAQGKFMIRSKAFGGAYGFRNYQYKVISDLNPEIKAELAKSIDMKSIPEELLDKLVGLEERTPTSPFYDQAGLLFKVYLYEMLEWFNSLKSIYRQDMLALTLDSDTKDVIETNGVVQAIENVVNQDSSIIYDQSVNTLIAKIIGTSFNNVRVLPGVDSYSRAEFLKWNDRSEDNDKLTQDSENAKNMILNSMGIPSELMTANNNRWEILSRSERYLTSITTYLDFITDIVKSCVQSMLLTKGILVQKSDIIFDMKNDTDIQSQIARHKIDRLESDTVKLSNIINNTNILMSTGYFDTERAISELINEVTDSGALLSSSFKDTNEILDMLAGGNQ